MAAFILDPPSGASLRVCSGERLNIFPGSAVPEIFAAGVSFWIGYGFVPEINGHDDAASMIGSETAFELDVDGAPVSLHTDRRLEDERIVSTFSCASFPNGLPAGWHRFSGRWYVAGKLALSNDKSIEFTER